MGAEGFVVLYTLVFAFYSFLEISGSMPQEIRSAGLTLTSLFSRYYGDQVERLEKEFLNIYYSQDIDFVGYHMRRTTGAIIIHSFLPLLYTIGLQFVYPHFNIVSNATWPLPAKILKLFCRYFSGKFRQR